MYVICTQYLPDSEFFYLAYSPDDKIIHNDCCPDGYFWTAEKHYLECLAKYNKEHPMIFFSRKDALAFITVAISFPISAIVFVTEYFPPKDVKYEPVDKNELRRIINGYYGNKNMKGEFSK